MERKALEASLKKVCLLMSFFTLCKEKKKVLLLAFIIKGGATGVSILPKWW